MSKVVKISDDVYPIDDVIKDLESIKTDIKDLIFVTILKDGTAYVSHTGVGFINIALACKLLDKEFSNLVDLNQEDEEDSLS